MKGEILFEKMTGISDEYIAEAALVAPVTAESGKKRRVASLSTAWRRGLSAACVCLIVAITAVGGLVAWGRMGTAGPGSDPNTQFTFSYSMTPINGKVNRGDTVTVDASMTNQGKAFTTSDFFPYAQFILQGNDSVVIQGVYALDESTEKRKIENGDQASRYFIFSIPENAVEGTYDLVISYKKEQQVYSGVLEVDTDHTAPEYSFGYKPVKQFYHIGETVTMEAWVINNREFLYKGELYGFKPTPACLEHRQSGYRIQGITTAWDGYTTTIIPAGTKGMAEYQFSLLTGVPTGEYDLILTYKDCEQRFEQVLTVGESTSETDYPPVDITDHLFSFGYEPFGGFAIPGDFVRIEAWVINNGEPFTYIGNSYKETGRFYPTVTLYHQETGYTIKVLPPETAIEPILYTVETGEKGKNTYARMIPTDAPTGEYGLVLSYGGVSKSFEGVLTVAEPTVEAPAVLSNLTMPVGSEWLYEPIDEAYVPGELVTVRFKCVADMEPLLILNEAFVEATEGDEQTGYLEYSFLMPQKDSEIIFHTYDGTAPYAYLLKSYYTAHPKAESASVGRVYGEYENGAVAALINGTPTTALAWEESIYTKKIRYTNGNQIWVYHEGSLYTVQEAFAQGILSLADIEMIENTQKDLYPDLYAYDLELIRIAREYLSTYIPSDTLDDYSANVGMMPESFSYDVVRFYADPWGEQIALVWVDRDTYACTHEIDEERFKKLESYRPYLTEENMAAALRAIEAQFLDYNTYLLSPELRGTIYDMHLSVSSRLNELILYGTYYSPAVGGHHIKQHNFEVKICDYT